MSRQQVITDLFEVMDLAKRGMHNRMQIMMQGSGISRAQLELLFTIQYNQPLTAKALAHRLRLTPGAVSQLVDSLETKQLIQRAIDPNDRRRQLLSISKAGMELVRTIDKRRNQILESVMRSLSDEELTTWLHIQRKLIEEFNAATPETTTSTTN